MKLLIILSSHEFEMIYYNNIIVLRDYFKLYKNTTIDYCGISNKNDFSNYETIITFKYKIINTNSQLSKICEFISEYKNELQYDWYIKIRPNIQLLSQINFDDLCNVSINARARVYRGPKRIKYGMSVNGKGMWENIGDCIYDDCEKEIVLDDQLYIFHRNIIERGGFDKFNPEINDNLYIASGMLCKWQHEWFHSNLWKFRNIKLNIIGINALFMKKDNYAYSGDINLY